MKELIRETNYWNIFLVEDQAYLGRCAIYLKRNCNELSGLNSNEWEDFGEVVIKLEEALKKTFDATMFNWTCMMNNAYRKDKPNIAQVHLHFRPRYKNKIEFAGEIFEDIEFGHHYDRARRKVISKETLLKISEEIKKNF